MEKYSIDSGRQVVNVGTRRRQDAVRGWLFGLVASTGYRRRVVNVGPDRQVVYCRPGVPFPGAGKVGRFPVPETL